MIKNAYVVAVWVKEEWGTGYWTLFLHFSVQMHPSQRVVKKVGAETDAKSNPSLALL